jgi:hypothetical protein
LERVRSPYSKVRNRIGTFLHLSDDGRAGVYPVAVQPDDNQGGRGEEWFISVQGSEIAGLAVLMVATASAAQTFDVNGQTSSSTSSAPSKKHAAPSSSNPTNNNETGMGWGASIEVAREARAAQTALQHGDAAGATAHAQRAVNAAPQNPDLWFTLAYAARLSGQYSLSVDAYRRGSL